MLPPKSCSVYNGKDSGMSELEALLSPSLILKIRRLRRRDLEQLAAGCTEPMAAEPGPALRARTQQCLSARCWPLPIQHSLCAPSALGPPPPPQHPALCRTHTREVLNKYLLMDCFYACVSQCPGGLYVPPGVKHASLYAILCPFWYSVQTWL